METEKALSKIQTIFTNPTLTLTEKTRPTHEPPFRAFLKTNVTSVCASKFASPIWTALKLLNRIDKWRSLQ